MEVLHGARVVDLGNFITGPYCAMLLGELGADVVKIERPGEGDPFRAFKSGRYSPQFQSHNRYKRSVTIDYAKPAGLALADAILERADVVIVNNRPGVAEKLGLGWARLHALNPRLVYCAISGFGPDGPYVSRPAYDNVGQTLSGWLSLFHGGGDPRIAGPAVTDGLTGVFAALGVLGALVDRAANGRGRRVDISMLEATLAFATEPVGHFFATGEAPGPYTRGAMSQAYLLECKDGRRIGLHMSSPEKFWQGLARAIERPDLLARYPDREARVEHYKEIGAELASIFVLRTRDDWVARLEANDVPFAPERRIDEFERDPQIAHLEMVRTLSHPRHGALRALRRPVRYDGERERAMRPPPELGEHTDEILTELGRSAEEIAALRREGIV